MRRIVQARANVAHAGARASEPIQVEAPDAASAAYLMKEAVCRFKARLIATATGRWEVHFHPDRERSRLFRDVCDLVEQWLRDRCLLSVTLRVDGRCYTIRNTRSAGWPAAA